MEHLLENLSKWDWGLIISIASLVYAVLSGVLARCEQQTQHSFLKGLKPSIGREVPRDEIITAINDEMARLIPERWHERVWRFIWRTLMGVLAIALFALILRLGR